MQQHHLAWSPLQPLLEYFAFPSLPLQISHTKPRNFDDGPANKLTEKMKDSQPFAKLKEVFSQRTCGRKITTLNFAQPHSVSVETLFSIE